MGSMHILMHRLRYGKYAHIDAQIKIWEVCTLMHRLRYGKYAHIDAQITVFTKIKFYGDIDLHVVSACSFV
jgi:hypothetical protein